MELKQKLLSDLKGAMKAKDALRVDTLRMVSAEIKNREIDLKKELSEGELLALLTTQLKRRKEAIVLYEKGGRSELVEKEQQEAAILEGYLPAQVSEEELRTRLSAIIRETGAEGARDMGKVMKVAAPEFKGKADGNRLRDLVQELLS